MINQYLQKHGYKTVDDEFYGQINRWLSWYEGKVKAFHNYTVYNGRERVPVERYSLCMAKKTCEDWANLIMNEKVAINISDSAAQDLVGQVLEQNNFRVRANQLIELSFALGTGAFVEYLDRGEPAIDYIRADMIRPIAWDNGEVISCAFCSQKRIDGKDMVYINIHTKENDGVYHIRNVLLDKTTQREADLPPYIEPEVNTGLTTPSFQIIRPNIINNMALDCPMGISVYANALDVLKGIDLVYDSYINEFRLGKKRIIVPMDKAKVIMEKDGVVTPIFDSNDVEYVAMDIDQDKGIKEINMELRAEPHEKGLQRNLNLLSSKVGLGNDRYNYEKGGMKTATEVISEKSDLYQNLKKNETLIGQALVNMVRQITLLAGQRADFEVTVDFDDSIIEDDAAIQQKALLEFQSGAIDVAEYLAITRKIDRETAVKKAAEMGIGNQSQLEQDPFAE